MAASAKPRQVLECLNLIGKPSHIEKLKSNEGCRISVITMLTAQISKRNIIPNLDLVRAGMNGLLACQGIDEEIYRLLKEFMQICYFLNQIIRKYSILINGKKKIQMILMRIH